MTDCDRMLDELAKAGPAGVHSHDLRRMGISGNPSQRAADLEAKGHKLRRVRENRGKRPGVRYFLVSDRLVGVGAGKFGSQVVSDASRVVADAESSADPGESRVGGRGQARGERSLSSCEPAGATPGPASARLFEPEPPRPMNPLTDREAA